MDMKGEGDKDVHRKIEKRSKKNKEKDKKKRKLELKNDEREYEKIRKKDKRIKMEKDQYNNDGEATEIKEASKEKTQVEGGENRRGLQMNDGKDCELEARKDKKKRHKENRNKDGIDMVSSLIEIPEDEKLGKYKVVKGRENYEKEDVAEMKKGEEGDKNKKNKRGKKDKEGSDVEGKNSTRNGKETRKARKHADGDITEKVEHAKKRKRKKKNDKDDLGAGLRDVLAVKPGNGSTVRTSKRVRFSGHVEVFPSSDGPSVGKKNQEENLVRGKRFSQEEDEMIKESISNYIEARGLGEEGINMILHCKSYPEIKNCWKEIGAALPWRPSESIYNRAHVLFERAEKRVWTSDEYELIRRFHEQHGSDWRMLADTLGKHRFHVKDTWRRIKLPNMKRGNWSQAEYQNLFDLVNMDLRMKAFEEKKSKHGMLRDNICWGAISDKLSTRIDSACCLKWYNQLTSAMVAEGKWADADDYRLLNVLLNLDACCVEDVDWDNLLDHRSGDVCLRRWIQMVNHIGEHGNKSFAEQVEVLSKRYCPDILEAREAYDSKPAVP